MYIITLTLTDQKFKAPDFMAAHNAWIAKGFDDEVFLLVGSLTPQGGGAILANGPDLDTIKARIAEDPFVQEGIATPHVQQVTPARTDDRFSFLKDSAT